MIKNEITEERPGRPARGGANSARASRHASPPAPRPHPQCFFGFVRGLCTSQYGHSQVERGMRVSCTQRMWNHS